ncbi:hypothetical protein JOW62_23740 [Escherichia coli]
MAYLKQNGLVSVKDVLRWPGLKHSQRQELQWRWWCIRFAAGDSKQKPQIDGPGFLKETNRNNNCRYLLPPMTSKRISGERIAPF